MSLSEIIQRRFKNKIVTREIKTAHDIEDYVIAPPKTVNAE